MKKTTSRRGNNEGSVYRRKDGRWVGSATIGFDENGKQIRKSYYGKTRSEVTLKIADTVNYLLQGGKISTTNEDLQTLMHEWLMTFKRAAVTSRSFENDLSRAKLYIYPQIGNMKLGEINTAHIQRLLNNMQLNGYALDTVKKTKFLLRQFFEYCVDSGFVRNNPVNKIKLQTKERKIIQNGETEEYKAIPKEVRQKFFDEIQSHKFLKPLCLTILFAGLRIGEALALKWGDVDLDNETIKVRKAATKETEFDKDGNVIKRTTVISDTKTVASVRELPVLDLLVDVLKDWKTERWVQGNLLSASGNSVSLVKNNDFVFGNKQGALRSYSGTKSIFDRFIEKIGLYEYNIHLHTLRHTFSNMLFEANENPKVIQALLGHKSVITTLKDYNSVDNEHVRSATNRLGNQFRKKDKDSEM